MYLALWIMGIVIFWRMSRVPWSNFWLHCFSIQEINGSFIILAVVFVFCKRLDIFFLTCWMALADYNGGAVIWSLCVLGFFINFFDHNVCYLLKEKFQGATLDLDEWKHAISIVARCFEERRILSCLKAMHRVNPFMNQYYQCFFLNGKIAYCDFVWLKQWVPLFMVYFNFWSMLLLDL